MKNTLALKIIICTLAVFIDVRTCLAQQFTDLAKPQLDEAVNELTPVTLSAGLKFDRKAEPLDPLLLPGNLFDKEVAAALLRKAEKPTEQWHKVPLWQAGEWGTEQATNTRAVSYKNGLVEDSEPVGVYKMGTNYSVGMLKDKNGDIWDQYSTGEWTETKYDAYVSYSYIYFQSAGKGDYPDLYTKMASFSVDPKTRKIDSVSRSKNWQRRINLAPGIMKEETVKTVLAESGSPELTAWNTSVARRLKTFSSYENLLDDQEKREASFREFCRSEGLGDLLGITDVDIIRKIFDSYKGEVKLGTKSRKNLRPVKRSAAPAARKVSPAKAKTRH